MLLFLYRAIFGQIIMKKKKNKNDDEFSNIGCENSSAKLQNSGRWLRTA